ncbi:lipoate-protein ligase B [Actinoplanes campanulatus]|uniref:Octanoyltransferase n=1 Tax=Actinoplanes campanulatus TaxID=113559 RepID=A0A7W5AGG4_9ACTN|nr:lipoyl(octanoyl) transferase LipB [Actinoplanes campanulatus]MBB3095524.1 lipoate-protein ligase B [Actinoplanes campanulatus]GGN09598.1 octanoyltransferase [Actinoplanes campanulatus]GID36415.1 octanoyltransferase [Actinoplanes campanulatus]
MRENRTSPPLGRVDLGEVPYERAMADMDEWVRQRRERATGDRLFLLSHPPVVTYGRATSPEHFAVLFPGIPAVPTDRGGLATYHGPGQLVGYLVLGLRDRGPGDIVRWLELGLIAALADLGLAAVRRDTPRGATSLVGVWTPDHRKVASIGMRVRGTITSHGFALNIDPDMSVYDTFTACGLRDVEMTSVRQLAAEQGVRMPSDAEIRNAVAGRLGAVTTG